MSLRELVQGPAKSPGLGGNDTRLQDADQEESSVPWDGAMPKRQVTQRRPCCLKQVSRQLLERVHPSRGR